MTDTGGRRLSFILVLLLWIFSIITWVFLDVRVFQFNGFDYRTFMSLTLWLQLLRAVFSTLCIMAAVLLPIGWRHKGEYIAWLTLLAVVVSIISLGITLGGIIHLVLALLFFIVFYAAEEDKAALVYLVCGLLIFDFVIYGVIGAIINNAAVFSRVIFPVWVIFIPGFAYVKNPDERFGILFAITAVFWMLIAFDGIAVVGRGAQSILTQNVAQEGFNTLLSRLKKSAEGFTDIIKGGIDGSIQYATGDYYTGTVEQNKDEPLGVYLVDVEAADPEYWEGDVVTIWGDIKAKTFDREIAIELSCIASDNNGSVYEAEVVKPEQRPFRVTAYSEASFLCRFANPTLPAGYYDIRVLAEFNFETLAYLRTYLMRGENLLSKKKELRDNGQDYSNAGVLTSFGLPTSPVAVYTNGPVRIGVKTFEPPIRVDPSTGVDPYFGLTVENAWPKGMIKDLTKLELLVPQPVTIDTGTCGSDVFQSGSVDESRGEGGYNKYVYSLNNQGKTTNISQYSSFRCYMNIDESALDNTPAPTVRTLKVNAGYNYILEESLTLQVRQEQEII